MPTVYSANQIYPYNAMMPLTELKGLPSIPLNHKSMLPEIVAIYFIKDNTNLYYIGQTANLCKRFNAHPVVKQLVKQVKLDDVVVTWVECETYELRVLETLAIKEFQPIMNKTAPVADKKDERRAIAPLSPYYQDLLNAEAYINRKSQAEQAKTLICEALDERAETVFKYCEEQKCSPIKSRDLIELIAAQKVVSADPVDWWTIAL